MSRGGRACVTALICLLCLASSHSSSAKEGAPPAGSEPKGGVVDAADGELAHFTCEIKGKANPTAKGAEAKARKLAEKGRAEEALRCALYAANLKPDSPDLWLLAAETAKVLPERAIKGAGDAPLTDCHFYSKAAALTTGPKELRVARSVEAAQCTAGRGDCRGAFLALWGVCKAYMDDFGVSLQASIVLAELGAAGTCEWSIAHKAFTELHKRFPTGNAHSYRSAALVLTQMNNMSGAMDLFKKSLSIQEDDYTHSQAAVTCRFLGRYEEALHHAERALALRPAQKEYHLDIGLALSKLGRYTEAIKHLKKARKAMPDDWAVLQELGMCNMGLGEYATAAGLLEQAVQKGASDYRLMLLAASAYSKLMRHNDTRTAYDKAAAMCDSARAHLSEADRGSACVLAHGRRLEHMQRVCDWAEWDRYVDLEGIMMHRDSSERVLTPFQLTKGPFSMDALLLLSRAEAVKKQPTPVPQVEKENLPAALLPGPLRVGFLWIGTYESEFANNVITVLEELQKDARIETFWLALNEEGSEADERIEILWLALNEEGSEEEPGLYDTRRRTSALFGQRLVHYRTDPERVNHQEGAGVAGAMRGLRLHTVVNLPGWLNEASMSVSAGVPAVHQASFKGYAGTLGASFVQHLITDHISSPPELSELYSEKLVYMPKTYYPVANAATARGLGSFGQGLGAGEREKHGLPSEGAVLAAFNDHYKIEPSVWDAWVGLLRALPGSVIWMLQHGAEESLKQKLQAIGIDPGRIVVSRFFPKDQHLLIKGLSHVFLDTPLYNGHSTTSDMLWAQVPVVTLPGEKMAARAASGIIMAAGAGVGLARNMQDYSDLAVRLFQRHASRTMRAPGGVLVHAQLAKTHPFDPAGYARRLSRALRCMHEAGVGFHVVVADL